MEYLRSVLDNVGVVALAAFTVLAFRFGQGEGRKKAFSYNSDKHVMITGGSSGIGLEVAKECIRRNASAVTIVARDVRKLEEAKTVLDAFAKEQMKKTTVAIVSVDCGSNQETVDQALLPCISAQPVDALVRRTSSE